MAQFHLMARPLHVVATFMDPYVVEGLVELMSKDDLKLKDAYGCGPLDHVCSIGITQFARYMTNKNKKILTILESNENLLPLTKVVVRRYKEMDEYIYSVTPLGILFLGKGYHGATLLM